MQNGLAMQLPTDPDQLAVIAAMELLDLDWPMATIAKALTRDESWLTAAIDKTLAAATTH